MALRALKKLITGSFELNQVQANLDQLWTQLSLNPFVTGQWLKSQALANGTTKLSHSLGRLPQGWIITNVNGAATIYLASNSLTTTSLSLTSSAAVTVDIWVF